MDDGVDQVLEGRDRTVLEIVDELRRLVTAAVPELIEEPDPADDLIGYTFLPGTYTHLVAAIAPHARHVNLMFARGAELTGLDTHGLFEGTGKKARHIKFRTVADVARPGVRDLLTAAAELTPRP